jgi:glucan phosphoethanolaminetransferase (alkaline phosphatase superfamily)
MAVFGIRPKEGDSYFVIYLKYLWIFVFVFFLFTMNLFAVSISLQCNKNESIFFRIVSAMFAFFFGLVYIALNYFTYRIKIKKEYCQFNKDNPFPFSTK